MASWPTCFLPRHRLVIVVDVVGEGPVILLSNFSIFSFARQVRPSYLNEIKSSIHAPLLHALLLELSHSLTCPTFPRRPRPFRATHPFITPCPRLPHAQATLSPAHCASRRRCLPGSHIRAYIPSPPLRIISTRRAPPPFLPPSLRMPFSACLFLRDMRTTHLRDRTRSRHPLE